MHSILRYSRNEEGLTREVGSFLLLLFVGYCDGIMENKAGFYILISNTLS